MAQTNDTGRPTAVARPGSSQPPPAATVPPNAVSPNAPSAYPPSAVSPNAPSAYPPNAVSPNAPNAYPPNAVSPNAPNAYPPNAVSPNAPNAYPPNAVSPNAPNAYPPNAVSPNAPNAYPPGAYPADAVPPDGAVVPTPQTKDLEVEYSLHQFAFGAGIGLGGLGWGQERSDCDGEACGTTTVGVREYSSRISGLLQAQAFYQPLKLLRFGPAIRVNGSSKLRFERARVGAISGLGSLVSVNAAIELTPRLTHRSWLLPRLESGLSVLFPSSAFTNRMETLQSACSQGGFSNCDSFGERKYGFNLGAGAGAGILWAASEAVKLRFDCLLQYYSFGMFEVNSEQGERYSDKISGMWFMAHGGVEF